MFSREKHKLCTYIQFLGTHTSGNGPICWNFMFTFSPHKMKIVSNLIERDSSEAWNYIMIPKYNNASIVYLRQLCLKNLEYMQYEQERSQLVVLNRMNAEWAHYVVRTLITLLIHIFPRVCRPFFDLTYVPNIGFFIRHRKGGIKFWLKTPTWDGFWIRRLTGRISAIENSMLN